MARNPLTTKVLEQLIELLKHHNFQIRATLFLIYVLKLLDDHQPGPRVCCVLHCTAREQAAARFGPWSNSTRNYLNLKSIHPTCVWVLVQYLATKLYMC